MSQQTPTYITIANNDRFWEITRKLFMCLPWLWLGLLTILITGAIGQSGSWPSYGQPDPKQISGFGLLVTPLLLLMMITLGSLPFGLLFTAFSAWQGVPYTSNKKQTTLYLLGLFLFLSIVIGDLAGIMTWLID